jgi:hypothetical protein
MTRQTDTQEQTMTNDVTVTVPRYSNAHLDLALAGYASIGMHERAVRYLRDATLTAEQRERAVSVAHTIGNMRGGRWSDNVREAIALVGANDGEVYPERFAREDRERQQAQRAHALRIAALQVTA